MFFERPHSKESVHLVRRLWMAAGGPRVASEVTVGEHAFIFVLLYVVGGERVLWRRRFTHGHWWAFGVFVYLFLALRYACLLVVSRDEGTDDCASIVETW